MLITMQEIINNGLSAVIESNLNAEQIANSLPEFFELISDGSGFYDGI